MYQEFMYNERTYQISNEVGIRLALQLVLSRIFMAEFEYNVVQKLGDKIKVWRIFLITPHCLRIRKKC